MARIFFKTIIMKHFAIITIATIYLCIFPKISPAKENAINFGVSLLAFDYAEYLDGQFLDGETGPLPGVYTSYTSEISDNSYLTFVGNYHSGQLDYKGETQGSALPIKSISDADIIDANFVYGRWLGDLSKSAFPSSLYGGLGYRYWRRNINSTQTPSGNPVAGVLEFYDWFYLIAGVNGHIAKVDQISINYNIRATRMFQAEIEIDYQDFQNRDNNLLDLGEKWGVYISVPIAFKAWNRNITIEPYYQQWNIGRSNIEPITSNGVPTGMGVFEPRSETRNFGIFIYFTLNL